MRLDDDFEIDEEDDDNTDNYYNSLKKSNRSVMITAIVSMSLMLLLILVLILSNNKNRFKNNHNNISDNQVNNYEQIIAETEQQHFEQSMLEQSVDDLISGSTLTAQDLDIWDTGTNDLTQTTQSNENEAENTDGSSNNNSFEEQQNDDPSTDGLHTLIIHEDGKEEWVDINRYLASNTYNFSGLVCQNSIMKYYENNTKVSQLGVDISKVQDYVDFNALHRAGVDYVMIRLGQRGYQSGEISLDDNFEDNMQRAAGAGLDIGVYFFSQATTLEEAEEEANFVIETLQNYDIQYPVVYYMGNVPRETTRAESLDKMTRTNNAIRFMTLIEEAGYMPMLYGNKEWLIQKYSLGSIIGTDIWLSQEMDIPDYPYEFVMWQYTTNGKIDGIAGNANMSISFVDYSLR